MLFHIKAESEIQISYRGNMVGLDIMLLNAKGRRSAPGDDVSEGLIAFLDYVNGKGAGDEFTRRLDMAVANVINSDDFRVEYMSAVARYMEDEEEKEELRADIEKKQENG